MVPSERPVTVAIGHGKKAARNIDAWLRGGGYTAAGKHQLAGFGGLNTWYYADAPATVRPSLEAARRVTTFDEVVRGLNESTALFEAHRCMSCGNCFGCDNCYGVCPDNAIVKLADGQYEIDYDYCKGCGLCATGCPCNAIEMEPEQNLTARVPGRGQGAVRLCRHHVPPGWRSAPGAIPVRSCSARRAAA